MSSALSSFDSIRIVSAESAGDIAVVRSLFEEYAESLGVDLSFQSFEAELAGLPGAYAPPRGALMISVENSTPVGCVAVRPLEWPETAELKRLYVRPVARGRRLGALLTDAALTFASEAGYRRVRLDTLPTMSAALRLYESLGFRDIEPYRYNPVEGARYLELALNARRGSALIRESGASEFEDVLSVNRAAFGDESVPDLVRGVFDDPSARPVLSLVACQDERIVGHALFSSARLLWDGPVVSAVILGPLAVAPHVQRTGIGGRLIDEGARLLTESGVHLVFLAGHPSYYTRHGFEPASPYGLLPPFPITPEEAWMVRALAPGLLGKVHGTVKCADSLNRPEYWRE